uniref:NADH-ubiquinone oxidoreductase chain 2 n=1 Tax=Paroedura androyensis TaxID=454302 RepID=A7XI63_9SAUR|nr:NADH dehydrogenase subunit 2 [Paroedura androyensis]
MSPLIWALLIMTMSTSTVVTMSSHHWLLAWLRLELNTLSILPVIMKPSHPRATEAATKYFLIQALSAAMILFASTMNAWQTGQWSIINTTSTTSVAIITTGLALKLGLAPAHLWFMEVMQGTTLPTALIITTWQKIAPTTMLYLIQNHTSMNIMLCLGLTSTLVGAWTGLSQTQTRKILAASSIAHMGWVITALSLQQSLATMTFIIYILMTTTVFITLMTTAAKTLKDLSNAWSTTPPMLATTLLTIMSLAGLPPLTGFMPKWLILKELTLINLTTLSTALALSSLPSLFFYLRMSHLTVLTSPPDTMNTEQKWRLKPHHPTITTLTTALSTMLLPLIPLCHLTI